MWGLFWELDGGGPPQRFARAPDGPDVQFPQDVKPPVAPAAWRPLLGTERHGHRLSGPVFP
jgi:hypothetical protein